METALSPKGQCNLDQAWEHLRQFERTREPVYLDLTHYYLFRVREAELPVRGEVTDEEMRLGSDT